MTEPTAPLITSTQNPKIKRLLALQEKSSERRKSGLFVVEGRRELQHCIAAGYEVESVFVRPLSNSPRGGEDALSPSIKDAIGFAALPPTGGAGRGAVYYVSAHVYERIAYRGSTEGIVAIVKSQHLTLENIGCAALPPTGGAGSGALFIKIPLHLLINGTIYKTVYAFAQRFCVGLYFVSLAFWHGNGYLGLAASQRLLPSLRASVYFCGIVGSP